MVVHLIWHPVSSIILASKYPKPAIVELIMPDIKVDQYHELLDSDRIATTIKQKPIVIRVLRIGISIVAFARESIN